VWDFISRLLNDPEHIRRGIERMIAQERAGTKVDPEQEKNMWAEKLNQLDTKRLRYQEMAAEDLLTFEELRAKLAELQERREAIELELEHLRNRKEHIQELEKDRDALLESLAKMIPAGLNTLSGLERNKIYRMLHLTVTPAPEGYEVSGAFCTTEPCPPL